ncbi:MAG: sensor histidine kinase [Bacteroidales bacterium]
MKITREKIFSTKSIAIIVLILVITVIIPSYFYFRETYIISDPSKLAPGIISVLFTFIVTASIFAVNINMFQLLQKQYSTGSSFFRKLAVSLGTTSLTAAAVMTIVFLGFTWLFNEMLTPEDNITAMLIDHIAIAVVVNLIVVLIFEGWYYVKQYQSTLVATEKLMRENTESKWAALVSQVNPHFLFNSLNALHTLIPKSPEKAQQFVRKFSNIYRYVIDVKDKTVVQLKEEMEFAENYLFLQKIRYGTNLNIRTKIEAEKMTWYIPSLTVQLLIENAIKHNEISEENPLTIDIYSGNYHLVIKNNLQPRKEFMESHGTGLHNLKERYRLITQSEPVFYVENNYYLAIIPLLKDESE